MAAPLTPFININHNEATYHSLDMVDQGAYDALNFRYERNAFLEVVRRWLTAVAEGFEARPTTGQEIVDRWNDRRNYWVPRMHKRKTPRPTHTPALQAVAPVAIIPTVPPVTAQAGVANPAPVTVAALISPPAVAPVVFARGAHQQNRSSPGSPLAELSPRFACQGDEFAERQLSPTKGQADFIAHNLKMPWKFADVAFQEEPTPGVKRIPLAPTTSVYLFVRPNDSGDIEEQLAVKCLEVNEIAGVEYESTVDDANAAVRREIEVNQLVGSTRCSHISKYRGHSVRESESHVIRPDSDVARRFTQKSVYLYHDFAGCGDLQSLIDRHREKQKPINEHFIWYTLRELTEALIALNQGRGHFSKPHEPIVGLPTSDEFAAPPAEPWVPVLHLDIKTQNVFLETANSDYPVYPKPVLADFGVSCQATDDVVDLEYSSDKTAHCPRFAGTSGWHPPERHDSALILFPNDEGLMPDPEYEPYKWRLSEKSDIWALGLIAHKMMYAHRTDTVEDQDGDSRVITSVQDATLSVAGTWKNILRKRTILAGESHFTVSTADIAHLPDVYSARLCLLTAACLRHDIASRPSLTDLLDRCQQELTRLDALHGPVAGKRKQDDDTHDEFTILASDEKRDKKFAKFGIGRFYEPKHPHTRIELLDQYRDKYTEHVNEWANMQRPTVTAQDKVIDATLSFLLDEDRLDDSMLYEWAVKYLVSCLRKRTISRSGAYTLTAEYIEDNSGIDWIEEMFEPEIKTKILRHLRDTDDSWTLDTIAEVEGAQEALDAFNHAVIWGLMLLEDTMDGNPAEPRNPRLEEQSELHKGVYDWIFITPSGAFYKN